MHAYSEITNFTRDSAVLPIGVVLIVCTRVTLECGVQVVALRLAVRLRQFAARVFQVSSPYYEA